MSWYVLRGECEIGPLGEEALRALVGTGQITADTRLWREGLSDWTAACALPGVLGPRNPGSRSVSALAPPTGSAVASDSTRPSGSFVAGATVLELAPPWRRYWARSLDLIISMVLVAVLVGAIRPSLLAQLQATPGREWATMLVLLPCAFAMDTLVHWALGNTPGKAIAGIKPLAAGGARALSAPAHLRRNFGVYVFGFGLGLPLVSLLTLIYGYGRAAASEVSIWDRLSGSRVYALSDAQLRTWVTAGVYVLAATALFALGLRTQHNTSRYAASRPPAPALQRELSEAANAVNASSPRMIDNITRLDGARAGPGLLFTYEYTLTGIRVSLLSPTTLQSLRWRLSANVRQAACAGTALKPMLRLGTTVRFDYRDRDGGQLALVSVSSADCSS